MNTVETYIFVHDQDIIIDFINKKRFLEFDNLNYVFVGNKPTDKISNIKNVIIARNLKYNIEQYPKFTSYTGWYALCKNNIIKSKYVNLFEYDINYAENFVQKNKNLIEQSPDAIGYFKLSVDSPFFIEQSIFAEPLASEIEKRTKVNIYDLVSKLKVKNPLLQWPTTSNSTWRVDVLKLYVDWLAEYVDVLKTSNYAGHVVERSISFYFYINRSNVLLTEGLLEHLQLNSHKTDPFMPQDYDKFTTEYHKLKPVTANPLKVITFAKGNFVKSQETLKQHLTTVGVLDYIHYTDKDLSQKFKKQFEYLFKYERGYGYWIWKPYLILETLKKMKENETLLYIDSTDVPSADFLNFVNDHFIRNDILLITRGYNHGQWTKRDCFILMGCDNHLHHSQPQLEAGVIGIKNTPKNICLLEEWYTYCQNEQIITDSPNKYAENINNFKDHRHDQSILTNLAIKYNINSYYINDTLISYNANQPKVYG